MKKGLWFCTCVSCEIWGISIHFDSNYTYTKGYCLFQVIEGDTEARRLLDSEKNIPSFVFEYETASATLDFPIVSIKLCHKQYEVRRLLDSEKISSFV